MSATVEAIVAAWRLATSETRELVARLVSAADTVNYLLSVPGGEPGFDRPFRPEISADSDASQVRANLELYESLTTRYQGLPLDVLFALRAAQGVIPAWPAVDRKALTNGGPRIQAAVSELRDAYADVTRDRVSLGGAIEDSQARVWLFSRLDSVRVAPGGGLGDGTKLLIALGLAYVLFGGSDRK